MNPCKHEWIKIEVEEEVCRNCCTGKEHSFTISELRALYKVLEHEFISYENEEAHAVINKIMWILKENDVDRPVRSTTRSI